MKETVKINLSRRLFDLDADAYSKLKDYLDALTRYFYQKSPNEAEEIMQDIEQRIADILAGKLDEKKQVITLNDIEDVVANMGTIEDFTIEEEGDETESEQKTSSHQEETYNYHNRQFYRDLDRNIIGGVCSGIGAYFSIDPNWIRVIFVILFLLKGLGLIAYIILWIVIPAARTTAQKLSMRGRPVNVENIENAVKEEFVKIKENVRRFPENEAFKRTQNVFIEIFEVLGKVFLALLRVFIALLGIALAFAGLGLLLGILSIGTPFFWHFPHFHWLDNLHPYVHNYPLLGIALLILIIVPVIGIITGTIRFIFNSHKKHSVGSAFAWTLWVLALVFVIIAFTGGEKIFENRHIETAQTLNNGKTENMLYIGVENELNNSNYVNYFNIFNHEIIHDKATDKYYLKPQLEFRNSDNNKISIQLQEISNIPSSDEYQPWDDIHYNWQLRDSLLILQKYFSVDNDKIWYLPEVRVIIFLPKDQKIMIHKNVRELMDTEEPDSLTENLRYNTRLVMTEGGLQPLKN